jgi:hypothetical protein
MKCNLVTIAAERVDSMGDIIKIDGVTIPDKKLPVLKNFDHQSVIGYAEVYKLNKTLVADLSVTDDCAGLFPAIGFRVKKKRRENGIVVLEEIELMSIGVSIARNQDPLIEPL